jgi:shikimate dehydrogenase
MIESMPILAVAGRPVLHSMSPVLFRELFRASGAKAAYTRVAATSAVEALFLFRALGMSGMNLTAPFKEEAAAAGLAGGRIDELSADARLLGAVNCLVPLAGGKILGANTDPMGVLGGLRSRGVDPAGKRCLVLGAGGAGKAAALALISAGGEVVVANRTRSRADEVAARLGCASAGLEDLPALARRAEVIVSTLASDALPDPESWFPALSAEGGCAAVLDADYKTGRLARFAASRGLLVASGADWLVAQALPAYELFMRSSAPRSDATSNAALAALLAGSSRAYAAGRKIAIIGLMGAGKTRVGKALARLMNVAFVDSDGEIESDAGSTIPEIFAREGESGFRAREARVIDRMTSTPGPAVVSTGGGATVTGACAAMLAERCLVVWLYVSPKTAAARARGGGTALAARPLLAGGDPEARLTALEAERRGAYASSAELVVSTEGRGAEEAAEVIHDEISRLS